MAEDKKERGAERRGSIEADDEPAVNNFARKHNITTRQARGLIREVGSNPEKLDAAAGKFPKKGTKSG